MSGFLSLFAVQLGIGFYLGRSYSSGAAAAHSSVLAMRDEALLKFLQSFHYWGSAFGIVFGGILLLAAVVLGRYQKEDRPLYFGLLGVLATTLGFQITGNLLPWDKHGVQSAAIEAGIAGRVPAVGPAATNLLFGGPGVSEATLDRWFLLHRIGLPAIAVAVLILGIVGVVKAKPGKAVVLGVLAVPVLVSIVAYLVASPLGSAASKEDSSSFGALPSFYTYPAHAFLVFTDRVSPGIGWIGAIVVPGILVALIAALPFLRPPAWLARVGSVLILGGIGYICAVSGASVAPITGTRDPVQSDESPTVVQTDTQDKALANRGESLFESKGCNGCHGDGAKGGPAGPSLSTSHLVHPDAKWFMNYIRDPQSVKKGSTMPAFSTLSDDELTALAEWLRFPQD